MRLKQVAAALSLLVLESICIGASALVIKLPLPSSPPRYRTALQYKIYGLDDEEEESQEESNNATPERTHTVFLRHLNYKFQLNQQSREPDGSVSQAGTPWEASAVLADFITHPQSGIYWQGQTVLELGSGIGICAIAASFMGANVIATDAATTSLNLLRENAALYNCPITVMPLLWGDQPQLAALPPINILMASDVVFFRSNRESLKTTLQTLCGPTTLVLMAHTWRTDPKDDEAFFDSLVLECGFVREEVPSHLLPQGYNQRGVDGRLPVSIFSFRRQQSQQYY